MGASYPEVDLLRHGSGPRGNGWQRSVNPTGTCVEG